MFHQTTGTLLARFHTYHATTCQINFFQELLTINFEQLMPWRTINQMGPSRLQPQTCNHLLPALCRADHHPI